MKTIVAHIEKTTQNIQGVPTLSEKSNFDTILRKICKISKVNIFS